MFLSVFLRSVKAKTGYFLTLDFFLKCFKNSKWNKWNIFFLFSAEPSCFCSCLEISCAVLWWFVLYFCCLQKLMPVISVPEGLRQEDCQEFHDRLVQMVIQVQLGVQRRHCLSRIFTCADLLPSRVQGCSDLQGFQQQSYLVQFVTVSFLKLT